MSRQTVILHVEGMHCGSCAANVEEALRDLPGVREVSVVLEKGEATVEYDPESSRVDEMEQAVRGLGFRIMKAGA